MPTERDSLLGEVRTLTARYQAGGRDAFEAFRDLVALLFRVTVLDTSGTVRLFAERHAPLATGRPRAERQAHSHAELYTVDSLYI